MVTLRTLEDVGYSREFFGLPQTNSTFYIFNTYQPSQQPGYWNLVGLNHTASDSSMHELQFFYIDEEARDYKNFSALQDANSFLSIYFEEFQALISFLEKKNDVETKHTTIEQVHFSLIHAQNLPGYHFSEMEAQQNVGNFYLYDPPTYVQTPDEVTIIKLPSWIAKNKAYALSTLAIATFERRRLENQTFHIFDAEWSGSIKFDSNTFTEFVSLLKQREQETLELLRARE